MYDVPHIVFSCGQVVFGSMEYIWACGVFVNRLFQMFQLCERIHYITINQAYYLHYHLLQDSLNPVYVPMAKSIVFIVDTRLQYPKQHKLMGCTNYFWFLLNSPSPDIPHSIFVFWYFWYFINCTKSAFPNTLTHTINCIWFVKLSPQHIAKPHPCHHLYNCV